MSPLNKGPWCLLNWEYWECPAGTGSAPSPGFPNPGIPTGRSRTRTPNPRFWGWSRAPFPAPSREFRARPFIGVGSAVSCFDPKFRPRAGSGRWKNSAGAAGGNLGGILGAGIHGRDGLGSFPWDLGNLGALRAGIHGWDGRGGIWGNFGELGRAEPQKGLGSSWWDLGILGGFGEAETGNSLLGVSGRAGIIPVEFGGKLVEFGKILREFGRVEMGNLLLEELGSSQWDLGEDLGEFWGLRPGTHCRDGLGSSQGDFGNLGGDFLGRVGTGNSWQG